MVCEKQVAVIMSVYINDTQLYIQKAVESIINQSFEDFDFYIQFDGNIQPEVDEYLSSIKDERIFILRRTVNKGLAISLNDLLSKVLPMGYEFIARMDADDISVPDRFEKQISFLKKHTDIDCLGGAIYEIDEKGKSRGKTTYYPCEPIAAKRFFMKRNPVAHPTVMFRRRFFEKTACFYPTDYERNEDTMLWYKGYLNGAIIANLPDVLLKFRMTDEMFTQRRNGKAFAKSQLDMRKKINKDLNFGLKANFYAYAMYLLMIAPSWILKIAYKVLR